MSCILPGPFFNSPFVHTKSPHFKQHSKYEGSLKTKYALANKYTTPKKNVHLIILKFYFYYYQYTDT